MKISKIETIQAQDHPQLLWVRIYTNDGLVGTGETTPRVDSVRRIIHDVLSRMLVGQDPRDIERHWHDMFSVVHYHGYAGAETRAISAVDIALWDLLGQITGQPVYRLLGGKVRDGIPIYNTCVSHGGYDDRELFLNDPRKLAQSLMSDGISAMKIWPFDGFSEKTRGHGISEGDLQKGVSILAAIREECGDRMEVALEGHACWDLPTAKKIARAVEPYNLMWLEDMMPADNAAAMKELKDVTATPLCVSERLFTRHQFLPILEHHAADYIMPDICWVGGISEILKIAVLASVYQLPIAPHNCGGPVQTAAYAHVASHIPNLLKVETVRSFYRTFYKDIVDKAPRIEQGQLFVSERPGLGLKLKEEFLEGKGIAKEVTKDNTVSVGWTAGDPWANDLGNRF